MARIHAFSLAFQVYAYLKKIKAFRTCKSWFCRTLEVEFCLEIYSTILIKVIKIKTFSNKAKLWYFRRWRMKYYSECWLTLIHSKFHEIYVCQLVKIDTFKLKSVSGKSIGIQAREVTSNKRTFKSYSMTIIYSVMKNVEKKLDQGVHNTHKLDFSDWSSRMVGSYLGNV